MICCCGYCLKLPFTPIASLQVNGIPSSGVSLAISSSDFTPLARNLSTFLASFKSVLVALVYHSVDVGMDLLGPLHVSFHDFFGAQLKRKNTQMSLYL
ncbi:hypothetical protein CEXT_371771 [Caerostris extrusa]|uniref:Uncharacterized protein n=1 Tax=Caerostris extrusa TaxID=172846 RepID=A0AAV4XWY1_CAEEX|nr:hypothetical protein CEXT_371771 [Caerostris extrusa]